MNVLIAQSIHPDSWLWRQEYQWFVKAYEYASTQTRCIPALSKISPEDVYFIFDTISRIKNDVKKCDKFKFYIDAQDIPEYPGEGMAFTLNENVVGTHDNGWTIEAEVCDDYFRWVNYFTATHPKIGSVHGDFEKGIFATSKRAYNHFMKHFKPEVWDYADI